MDRRLEIRMARRRVGNNMVSPDLMTWKQPWVDSLRHTSYAAASRSCQLAGTFSWSAVWSFVGRGHNWDPSAPCYWELLWITLWNRVWHTHLAFMAITLYVEGWFGRKKDGECREWWIKEKRVAEFQCIVGKWISKRPNMSSVVKCGKL